MTNGAGLSPAEFDAWRAFVLSAMQLTVRMDRHLQDERNLSLDDFGILTVLSESPDGELRFSDIARTLRMPKANVTYRFQRMERRGLVTRKACASDARGAFAVLTPDGRTVLAAAAGPHLERVRTMFVDRFEPEALPALATQFQRVLAALDTESS